jgi:hypothetical protein
VIERAVLLHENHDVLNIPDCARAVRCGQRQRALYSGRKKRDRSGSSGRELQEMTSILISHRLLSAIRRDSLTRVYHLTSP